MVSMGTNDCSSVNQQTKLVQSERSLGLALDVPDSILNGSSGTFGIYLLPEKNQAGETS